MVLTTFRAIAGHGQPGVPEHHSVPGSDEHTGGEVPAHARGVSHHAGHTLRLQPTLPEQHYQGETSAAPFSCLIFFSCNTLEGKVLSFSLQLHRFYGQSSTDKGKGWDGVGSEVVT